MLKNKTIREKSKEFLWIYQIKITIIKKIALTNNSLIILMEVKFISNNKI